MQLLKLLILEIKLIFKIIFDKNYRCSLLIERIFNNVTTGEFVNKFGFDTKFGDSLEVLSCCIFTTYFKYMADFNPDEHIVDSIEKLFKSIQHPIINSQSYDILNHKEKDMIIVIETLIDRINDVLKNEYDNKAYLYLMILMFYNVSDSIFSKNIMRYIYDKYDMDIHDIRMKLII